MSDTKVLVIGLDGVPLEIIQPWAEAGHLPVIASLMRDGAFGHLRSTIPPTSAPSWSTFATGKNPGKTGIYDFLYRRPGTYELPPVNASRRVGDPLWSLISRHGKRVGVINVPISYPVEPVNGFMISGWMTPYTARDVSYPPGLIHELREQLGDYHIYPTSTFTDGKPDPYFAACHDLLEMRTQSVLYLMQRYPWDFFMVVYFDPDRILHQVWHYLDPQHPWVQGKDNEDRSHYVRDYFAKVDEALGRILARVDDDTLVILMSDHGMGAAHYFIVLNLWLLQEGLLVLKDSAWARLKRWLFDHNFTLINLHRMVDRMGLAKRAEYTSPYGFDRYLKKMFLSFDDVDWSKTKAYSYGRHLGNIFLNVKGREPQGIIEPGAEYHRMREEIAERARRFRHPIGGYPVVGRILRREDVYTGPYVDQAPDLILCQREPTDIFFGLSDFGGNQLFQPVYRYSGMHRDHGMLFMRGQQIRSGHRIHGASLQDMAPTILYAMDLPVPTDMDGQVLLEAFDNGLDDVLPVRYETAIQSGNSQVQAADRSRQEEEQIIARLKDLGYL